MKGLIMRKSNFILSLLFMIIVIPCFAQSPEEIEQKMDEIKMNEAFIYGEDYNDDKDMAYQNALTELLSSINELRGEKRKDYIAVSDIQPILKELRYSKSTRNVSFLYIPLNQALSLTPKQKIDVASTEPNSPNNGVTTAQNLRTEDNTKFTFVPNTPQSNHNVISNSDKGILETLCSQDNWVEIKGFLKSFKDEGKIKETGNCLSYAEVPNDAYSILMDEMGGILSIMSPKNFPNRINHKTNQTDNENNHTNCKFIVWYK